MSSLKCKTKRHEKIMGFVTKMDKKEKETVGGMSTLRYTPIFIPGDIHNPDCPVYLTGDSNIPIDRTITVNGGQA